MLVTSEMLSEHVRTEIRVFAVKRLKSFRPIWVENKIGLHFEGINASNLYLDNNKFESWRIHNTM